MSTSLIVTLLPWFRQEGYQREKTRLEAEAGAGSGDEAG
jgi:hypothetical protein